MVNEIDAVLDDLHFGIITEHDAVNKLVIIAKELELELMTMIVKYSNRSSSE